MNQPSETSEFDNLTDTWPTTKLSLANLCPETATAPARLEGVVSLQWPFSQSASTIAFLVCEEDFRLRTSKGQLRVNFKGPVAKEVDARNIQIGNKIQLSLDGAHFEELPNPSPRDVPWTIEYSSRLRMKVAHVFKFLVY